MGALSGLFFLRVAGQALVVVFRPAFLPPMEQWYSGLVPYPVLLPLQILILSLQWKLVVDLRARRGWFAVARPRAGRVLKVASLVYFAVMAARFPLTMVLSPERRWTGAIIPIVFHWVLAGFLMTYGRVLAGSERDPSLAPESICGVRGRTFQ